MSLTGLKGLKEFRSLQELTAAAALDFKRLVIFSEFFVQIMWRNLKDKGSHGTKILLCELCKNRVRTELTECHELRLDPLSITVK